MLRNPSYTEDDDLKSIMLFSFIQWTRIYESLINFVLGNYFNTDLDFMECINLIVATNPFYNFCECFQLQPCEIFLEEELL